MYSIEGIHKNSGHQWRVLQAINFTYIPRGMRKRFLKQWMKEIEKPGQVKFTWKRVQSRWPFLEKAVRRYFFKPSYYIRNLEEIPFDEVEKVVISTWSKDFSKKITTSLLSKFKKALTFRKKANKKKKKKRK